MENVVVTVTEFWDFPTWNYFELNSRHPCRQSNDFDLHVVYWIFSVKNTLKYITQIQQSNLEYLNFLR